MVHGCRKKIQKSAKNLEEFFLVIHVFSIPEVNFD